MKKTFEENLNELEMIVKENGKLEDFEVDNEKND